MSSRVRAVLLVILVAATTSCANFETKYTGMGPANRAMAFSEEARGRFEASEAGLPPAELAKASQIDIYFDSVPDQLAVDGTTIAVREGANAELLGSVLMMPLWYMPDQASALGVMQRAVHAAGGDLAWCPREGVNWRCFIVRNGASSDAAAPATSTSTSTL